ncbi:hypothetical protein [Cumulibacter manganitolerans]|uniref:hypothetical protein n=1 Tax=Cumulibacter manganitolerans TaxID=1884992 RepID=UPI001295B46D|nr:hypothetical protein [Cumulibacter manganitolerans]
MPTDTDRRQGAIALAALTAAALVVDGVVHLAVAGRYEVPGGGLLTESNLFRAQAAVALLAAVWVIARPRPLAFAVAAVVAGIAAIAVIAYTYVDIGPIGPLPDLYEPTWAASGKVLSMVAEVCAVPLAIAGAVATRRRRGRRRLVAGRALRV